MPVSGLASEYRRALVGRGGSAVVPEWPAGDALTRWRRRGAARARTLRRHGRSRSPRPRTARRPKPSVVSKPALRMRPSSRLICSLSRYSRNSSPSSLSAQRSATMRSAASWSSAASARSKNSRSVAASGVMLWDPRKRSRGTRCPVGNQEERGRGRRMRSWNHKVGWLRRFDHGPTDPDARRTDPRPWPRPIPTPPGCVIHETTRGREADAATCPERGPARCAARARRATPRSAGSWRRSDASPRARGAPPTAAWRRPEHIETERRRGRRRRASPNRSRYGQATPARAVAEIRVRLASSR